MSTYKHYFMVDKKSVLHNNRHLCLQQECFAPGTDHHGEMDDEVFVWAVFSSEARLNTFESLPGVHPLPHPLEDGDKPIHDDHMEKLAPHLDVHVERTEVDHPDDLHLPATNRRKVVNRTFKDKRNNHAPLAVNFHTRQAMARLAETRDPAFKFRVF